MNSHFDRDITDEERFYLGLFTSMYNEKSKTAKQKREDEEFYYSDVEGTRTQFTKKTKAEIKAKYDIDISTKISFAITEQCIAFLTGTKPTTRLIANAASQKAWAGLYNKLHYNVWEESDGNGEVREAVQDMLVVGEGYLYVHPNNWFQESTFGVQFCHVPWTDVFIDPASRRRNRSDAEASCIAKAMPIWKAEAEFGIPLKTVNADPSLNEPSTPIDEIPDTYPDVTLSGTGAIDKYNRKRKWVWVKNFFRAEDTYLFISPEGHASHIRPTPVSIPNPEKERMAMELQTFAAELQMHEEQVAQSASGADTTMTMEEQGERRAVVLGEAAQAKIGAEEAQGQLQQGRFQLQQMMLAMQKLPDEVHVYEMETETKQKVYVEKFEKIKKRRIKRVLQVERFIVEKEWIPSDKFPIASFVFAQNRAPHRSYGMIHFIKDLVKAMNKLWALMILDLQIVGHGKWLYARGTIQNPRKWEAHASIPGSVNEYDPDPSLDNNGKPEFIPGVPPDQSMVQFVTMLTQLCEYVSGIFGIMQGNADAAPGTFGATQSLQSFGTQRIKLTGRTIESGLTELTYAIIKYLQRYCPDEAIRLLDEDGNGEELLLLRDLLDTRFKCKTQVTNSLPTVRQMALQMLSTLAGQTANPVVQDLLMQYALRLSDVKEMDEIAEQLDVVRGLQQQVQEQQKMLEDAQNQLRAAENNLAQKDIAMNAEKAKSDIAASAEIEKVKQQAEIQQQTQLPQGQPAPVF